MHKSHTLGNLVAHLLADQLTEQFVGKGEGGSRTFGCSDIAIDSNKVGSVGGTSKHLLETRIAGSFLTFKDSQLS